MIDELPGPIRGYAGMLYRFLEAYPYRDEVRGHVALALRELYDMAAYAQRQEWDTPATTKSISNAASDSKDTVRKSEDKKEQSTSLADQYLTHLHFDEKGRWGRYSLGWWLRRLPV